MQRPERERKEPTEFNVIVKAKDLVKHTFTITNSTERYPKKYRFTLVNRIQDKAVDIYECVLEANELDLRDAQEYRQRQKLQAKALTYCKELLFFIELSQEMGFISMSTQTITECHLADSLTYSTKSDRISRLDQTTVDHLSDLVIHCHYLTVIRKIVFIFLHRELHKYVARLFQFR